MDTEQELKDQIKTHQDALSKLEAYDSKPTMDGPDTVYKPEPKCLTALTALDEPKSRRELRDERKAT